MKKSIAVLFSIIALSVAVVLFSVPAFAETGDNEASWDSSWSDLFDNTGDNSNTQEDTNSEKDDSELQETLGEEPAQGQSNNTDQGNSQQDVSSNHSEEQKTNETPKRKKGCRGSVSGGSIVGVMMAIACVAVRKKKIK